MLFESLIILVLVVITARLIMRARRNAVLQEERLRRQAEFRARRSATVKRGKMADALVRKLKSSLDSTGRELRIRTKQEPSLHLIFIEDETSSRPVMEVRLDSLEGEAGAIVLVDRSRKGRGRTHEFPLTLIGTRRTYMRASVLIEGYCRRMRKTS